MLTESQAQAEMLAGGPMSPAMQHQCLMAALLAFAIFGALFIALVIGLCEKR